MDREKEWFPGEGGFVSHLDKGAMGSLALCLELILFLELSLAYANNFTELKKNPESRN